MDAQSPLGCVVLHGESLGQVPVVQVLGLGRCVSVCSQVCSSEISLLLASVHTDGGRASPWGLHA